MQISPEYLHHRVDRALKRLLCLSRDVKGIPEIPATRPTRANASASVAALYQAYLDDVLPVAKKAQHEWKHFVDASTKIHGSHSEGMRVSLVARLSGMSANEDFVSCIRRHWFAVTQNNLTLPLEERVAPEDVLLLWPYEDELEDIFQVVVTMAYWPLGLDDDGNWC